jgi:transcriptional regulator of arginine metabolism
MGSAAGAAVDQMELSGVIGTLAGDDTLLIIASDNENASEITAMLKDLI